MESKSMFIVCDMNANIDYIIYVWNGQVKNYRFIYVSVKIYSLNKKVQHFIFKYIVYMIKQ